MNEERAELPDFEREDQDDDPPELEICPHCGMLHGLPHAAGCPMIED